eukprot:3581846-Amphidinium_carterae.1
MDELPRTRTNCAERLKGLVLFVLKLSEEDRHNSDNITTHTDAARNKVRSVMFCSVALWL